MQEHEYATMYQSEDRHWWYVGLRTVMFKRLGLPRQPRTQALQQMRILDAGCGTGGTLNRLRAYPCAVGFDYSLTALSFCHLRGLNNVRQGSIGDIPFPSSEFDLVVSLDVMCDAGTPPESVILAELYRVLKPGGRLYLNLPAYSWLRGEHDIAAGVVRRYTAAHLTKLLTAAGFEVQRLTYWNTLLFPLVLAVRLSSRLGMPTDPNTARSDVKVPFAPLNRMLTNLIRLEAAWLGNHNLPFGSSLACVAVKPNVSSPGT